MGTRTYYIAEVICDYNDTTNFKIEKDVKCYLRDGEYSFEIYRDKTMASKFKKPFSSVPTAGPWYYKIKSIRNIEVTETFDKKEKYI